MLGGILVSTSLRVADESGLVGVAIVGNPLSASYMDGFMAEVKLENCRRNKTCFSPERGA